MNCKKQKRKSAEFFAMGEACLDIFIPNPDSKERTVDRPGLPEEKTLISELKVGYLTAYLDTCDPLS